MRESPQIQIIPIDKIWGFQPNVNRKCEYIYIYIYIYRYFFFLYNIYIYTINSKLWSLHFIFGFRVFENCLNMFPYHCTRAFSTVYFIMPVNAAKFLLLRFMRFFILFYFKAEFALLALLGCYYFILFYNWGFTLLALLCYFILLI